MNEHAVLMVIYEAMTGAPKLLDALNEAIPEGDERHSWLKMLNEMVRIAGVYKERENARFTSGGDKCA